MDDIERKNNTINLMAKEMNSVVMVLIKYSSDIGELEQESYGKIFYKDKGILEIKDEQERLEKLQDIAGTIIEKIEKGESVKEYESAFAIISAELEEKIVSSDERIPDYQSRLHTVKSVENFYQKCQNNPEKIEAAFEKAKSNPETYRYLMDAASEIIMLNSKVDLKKDKDYLKDIPPYLYTYEQITEYIQSNYPKSVANQKIERFNKDIDVFIKEHLIPANDSEIVYFDRRVVEQIRNVENIEELITHYQIKDIERKIRQKVILGRTDGKIAVINLRQYFENEFGIPVKQSMPSKNIPGYRALELDILKREVEVLSLKRTIAELEKTWGKERLNSETEEAYLFRAGKLEESGMKARNPNSLAIETDQIGEGSKISTSFLSLSESPLVLAKYLNKFKSDNDYVPTPTVVDCKKIYHILKDRLEKIEVNDGSEKAYNFPFTFEHEEQVLKSMLEDKRIKLTPENRQKMEERIQKIKQLETYKSRDDLPTDFFDTRRGYKEEKSQIYDYDFAIFNPEVSEMLKKVRAAKEKAEKLPKENYPFLDSSTNYDKDSKEVVGRKITKFSNADMEFLFQTAIPAEVIKPIDYFSLDLIEAATSLKNKRTLPGLQKGVILGILKGKSNFPEMIGKIFGNDALINKLQEESDFTIEELDFIESYYGKQQNIEAYMNETYKSPFKDKNAVATFGFDKRRDILTKLFKSQMFRIMVQENLPESVHGELNQLFNERFITPAYHASRTSTYNKETTYNTHFESSEFKGVSSIDVFFTRKIYPELKLKKELEKALSDDGNLEVKSKDAATRLKVVRNIKEAEREKRAKKQQVNKKEKIIEEK